LLYGDNRLSGWQWGCRVRDVDGHMRLISSGGEGDLMAARQRFSRLISADSHVYEPRDLWWKALGEKFGDRTPRVLDTYQGREGTFFYTGYQGV
jgi:hypothetical protein